MADFLLCHVHEPQECGSAFAAWRGFDSPLRRRQAWCSCRQGGHAIWWRVDTPDAETARALLPPYVAQRTDVIAFSETTIP